MTLLVFNKIPDRVVFKSTELDVGLAEYQTCCQLEFGKRVEKRNDNSVAAVNEWACINSFNFIEI